MTGKLKKLLTRLTLTNDLFKGRVGVNRATLGATVIRKDGSVENLGVVSRKKVTNAFVADLVNALANEAAYTNFNDFKFHDCGTGTNAESNTDTALQTPFGGSRESGTQVAGGSGSTRTYTSVATITFGASLAITEHGLFNAASTGTLMDRSVFSAINVDDGDSIQFTYELEVNSEA